MGKQRASPPESPLLGQRDRVWVTFGQTIQVAQYEPAKVDIGMASDVRDDETPEKAIARISEIVQEEVGTQISSLVKAKRKKRREE